jgi:hypothetical protein
VQAFASPREVEAFFDAWDLRDDVRSYLEFHSTRYVRLVEWVRAARAAVATDGTAQILDVGTFLQSELLRQGVPGALVHTSGHPAFERFGGWGAPQEGAQHLAFDLNDAQDSEHWPAAGPYDIVAMGEVIEHLHTAPALVLGCVRSWMAPRGRLVLQTPNAVALEKRLKLLAGRYPYDDINEDPASAGHFREYTVAELEAVAATVGLRLVDYAVENYFGLMTPRRRVLKRVTQRLPASLRDGITASFERVG